MGLQFIAGIGKLKREHQKLKKRYKKKHDVKKLKAVVINKRPWYKARFVKLSNYWYMDVRGYGRKKKEGSYDKENGVFFPVKDYFTTLQAADTYLKNKNKNKKQNKIKNKKHGGY